jgi:hypothetical protein
MKKSNGSSFQNLQGENFFWFSIFSIEREKKAGINLSFSFRSSSVFFSLSSDDGKTQNNRLWRVRFFAFFSLTFVLVFILLFFIARRARLASRNDFPKILGRILDGFVPERTTRGTRHRVREPIASENDQTEREKSVRALVGNRSGWGFNL